MGGPAIHILLVILQALAPILLPLLGVTPAGSAAHLATSALAAFGAAGTAHHYHKRKAKRLAAAAVAAAKAAA